MLIIVCAAYFWRWKNDHGYIGSYHTVVRVYHENRLFIKSKRRPYGITYADKAVEKAENLIQQDFSLTDPI